MLFAVEAIQLPSFEVWDVLRQEWTFTILLRQDVRMFFSAKSISAKVIITVMYDCISPIKTADSLTFNVRWFLELYIICLITWAKYRNFPFPVFALASKFHGPPAFSALPIHWFSCCPRYSFMMNDSVLPSSFCDQAFACMTAWVAKPYQSLD